MFEFDGVGLVVAAPSASGVVVLLGLSPDGAWDLIGGACGERELFGVAALRVLGERTEVSVAIFDDLHLIGSHSQPLASGEGKFVTVLATAPRPFLVLPGSEFRAVSWVLADQVSALDLNSSFENVWPWVAAQCIREYV